jgi:hypothetical protein
MLSILYLALIMLNSVLSPNPVETMLKYREEFEVVYEELGTIRREWKIGLDEETDGHVRFIRDLKLGTLDCVLDFLASTLQRRDEAAKA